MLPHANLRFQEALDWRKWTMQPPSFVRAVVIELHGVKNDERCIRLPLCASVPRPAPSLRGRPMRAAAAAGSATAPRRRLYSLGLR